MNLILQKTSCIALGISSLSSLAMARVWTNTSGRTIEADYISSDESSVVIKAAGKEYTYQLNQLSEADREFVRSQQTTTSDSTPSPNAPPSGWTSNFPIKPAFPDTKGYFASRNFKSVYKMFDDGEAPSVWGPVQKGQSEKEFTLEPGVQGVLYVPKGYDGSTAYGIYCHINSGDQGVRATDYAEVMERLKMIYVSPAGTSNQRPMLRRIRLALDATATVRSTFKIDPKRIVVGGISGGGHMAMYTHACFPDVFVGAVSHAAQSYLPTATVGHFPGIELSAFKSGNLKGHHWCVISGNKDQNYQEILKTSEEWKQNRLNYRFFDVPGMAHVNAKAADLETALRWMGM